MRPPRVPSSSVQETAQARVVARRNSSADMAVGLAPRRKRSVSQWLSKNVLAGPAFPRRHFDVVLIGAGPTSISALQGLGRGESIAVISGSSTTISPREIVHPKIQAVSVSNNEVPGVVSAYSRASNRRKPLLSSAIVGGLANYWGQQFLRYESGDPWPRDVFGDFATYEAQCAAVEKGFVFTGGSDVLLPATRAGYSARLPRLLVGSIESPASDLMAMRHAFRAQVNRTGAEVFGTRAASLERTQRVWRINLHDGEPITANRVLLAAGVLGTAQLISNSFQDVENARLSDHSPWMVYGFGMRRLFAQRPASSTHHFNAITLEKLEQASSAMFASLYDMGRADLNLLLASTISRTFHIFKSMRAPFGSALLKPVQIWTPLTFDEIDIDLHGGIAREIPNSHTSPRDDRILGEVLDVLRDLGASCLKVTRTLPGDGFHHHNLKIKSKGGGCVPVAAFLRQRTNDSVTCVDASVLPKIGLRPHTLTAMAASLQICSRLAIH